MKSFPKRIEDGEIKDPRSLGIGTDLTYYAFRDLLAKEDPIGYVKLIRFQTLSRESYRRCFFKFMYDADHQGKTDASNDMTTEQLATAVGNRSTDAHLRKRAQHICIKDAKRINAEVVESDYVKLKKEYGKERLRIAGQTIHAFWNPGSVVLPQPCQDQRYHARHPANLPAQQDHTEASLLRELLASFSMNVQGPASETSLKVDLNTLSCKFS